MGSNGKVFIWNHLVRVGKYPYTSTQNGKYFNIVEQLLDGLTGVGRLVALDNAFPTISLLRTAKTDWNRVIVATKIIFHKCQKIETFRRHILALMKNNFCSPFKVQGVPAKLQ